VGNFLYNGEVHTIDPKSRLMSNGHFAAYKNALKALSARTGAPLPSLILSFGILHEITAVVPLVGVFYGARTLGIGEGVINSITNDNPSSTETEVNWLREMSRNWVLEGDRWAGRVGRRYGIFGFEKQLPGTAGVESPQISSYMAGDVANAIVAYGVMKVSSTFNSAF
jgi:hypothetical protein